MENVTVPESDPSVEICFTLSSGITEAVLVTAETGPKSGNFNQATGTHILSLPSDYVHYTVCNIDSCYSKPCIGIASMHVHTLYGICFLKGRGLLLYHIIHIGVSAFVLPSLKWHTLLEEPKSR